MNKRIAKLAATVTAAVIGVGAGTFHFSQPARAQVPLPQPLDQIMMWSNVDENPGDRAYTTFTELNTMQINVPGNGYLVITGSAFVNNNTLQCPPAAPAPTCDSSPGDGRTLKLIPFVDRLVERAGAQQMLSDEQAFVQNDNNEWATLSYTATVPVTKGTHRVGQSGGFAGGSVGNFTTDWANIAITYYPGSISTVTPSPYT